MKMNVMFCLMSDSGVGEGYFVVKSYFGRPTPVVVTMRERTFAFGFMFPNLVGNPTK